MPGRLARRYDEPVEVERRDDVPIRFVRRGRPHRVVAVLAHWWETGPWWETGWETGSDVIGVGAGVVGDDERELWRVEAVAAGRSAPPAVVELCQSWSTGAWTLTGVLD